MKLYASGAVVLALGLVVPKAMAGAAYGTAGCGLGSIVFGNKPGMIQIVAATLNMTGYQTLAITTGTSNCGGSGGGGGDEGGGDDEGGKKKDKKKKDKKSSSVIEQTNFVAANMATLNREVAQGGGDSLAALASELGCDDDVYSQFTKSLQAAHQDIFVGSEASMILSHVKATLHTSPTLLSSCDALTSDLAQSK